MVTRLKPALLQWFDLHARELPWRKPFSATDRFGVKYGPEKVFMRRSPYTTWIAEIMLQQTQVATVVPYFQKWLRRFPNALALAKASEEEVLRHWAGLGYYARARNLHRGAQILVESGQYPITSEGWRALPGIGPYTAGAIASLAFDLPEPILDGNVIRVLSRLFGLAFLPGEGGRQRDAYWELARLWPKESRSGDTNEALMELGALVCTPAAPRCGDCPMAFGCQAKRQRWQNSLPPSKPRACVEPVMGIALVAKNRNSVLMESRPKGSFLAGHDLFPLFLGGQEKDWAGGFAERFPGWKWSEAPREVGRVRHSIMNRRYDLRVMGVTLHASLKILRKKSGKVTPAPKWILGPEIEASLTNSLARKIWGQIKAD